MCILLVKMGKQVVKTIKGSRRKVLIKLDKQSTKVRKCRIVKIKKKPKPKPKVTVKIEYDRYDKKKVLGYTSYFKNKKHGVQVEYDFAGNISSVINWKDGVQEGVDVKFKWRHNNVYNDTTVSSVTNYKEGLKYGSHLKWHQSGRLLEEQIYTDDFLEGVTTKWAISDNCVSRLIKSTPYKKGYKDGFVKRWNSEGVQTSNCYWKDGLLDKDMEKI